MGAPDGAWPVAGRPDAVMACPSCGTEIAPGRLTCPVCHWLVYSLPLKSLAREAEAAEKAGDLQTAIVKWRSALDLLPPSSAQADTIARRVGDLTSRAPAAAKAADKPAWATKAGILGTAALLIWNLKFVLVFAVTKAKLLFTGFTQLGTLLSMAAMMGLYWAAWGWRFGVGIVVSIYIHEMGHVAALHRLGIAASAPMFVPGFGAFVRMKQNPVNPHEDAQVGLAGPVWGLGTALVAAALFLATQNAFWGAVAHWGAWINLFNLIPIWHLDGGRGWRALNRAERGLLVGVVGVSLLLSHQGFLWLLLIMGGIRLFEAPGPGDRSAFWTFAILVAALSAISTIPVAVGVP